MSDTDGIPVRRYGSKGPEVAVLHGGPGAPGSVARLAIDLSSDFRTLEPLQRRSGEVPLTVDQHVSDHVALLHGPTRLVGHSWGAMLGLSLAARRPDLVDRLVLVGCGTYDDASRATHDREMAERLGADGREEKDRLKAAMAAAKGDELDRLLGERARQSTLAQSYELVDDALDPAPTDLPLDAVGHAETWADVLRRQHQHIDPASFVTIRCPVLMLHGNADPHPGPSTYETLRHHIPQLSYLELERCGHTPWLERQVRDAFLDHLIDWLR